MSTLGQAIAGLFGYLALAALIGIGIGNLFKRGSAPYVNHDEEPTEPEAPPRRVVVDRTKRPEDSGDGIVLGGGHEVQT